MLCPGLVYPYSLHMACSGDGSIKAPARLAVACRSGALGGGLASKLLVCLVGGGNATGTSAREQHVQVLVQLPVQVCLYGDGALIKCPIALSPCTCVWSRTRLGISLFTSQSMLSTYMLSPFPPHPLYHVLLIHAQMYCVLVVHLTSWSTASLLTTPRLHLLHLYPRS